MALKRWVTNTIERRAPLLVALVVGVTGVVNLLVGLGVLGNLPVQGPLIPLNDALTEGFAALGRSTQIGLGAALTLASGGLLLRLRSAWAFSILLLVAMLVANVAQSNGHELLLYGPIVLVLGLLIVSSSAFSRQAIAASLLLAVISLTVILGYATLGTYLLGRGFDPVISDLPTALYYSIITVTTVGFGDITPTTTQTRMFTLSIIVFGLGIFATTVATVFGTAVSNNLRRVLSPKGVAMNLNDHIILVGSGLIADNTALELRQRKRSFVRIVTAATETTDTEIIGDAGEDATLKQAGIKDARLVIAASDDEAENAMTALSAKELNPNVRVLALAETPAHVPRLKRARADVAFAPAAVGDACWLRWRKANLSGMSSATYCLVTRPRQYEWAVSLAKAPSR